MKTCSWKHEWFFGANTLQGKKLNRTYKTECKRFFFSRWVAQIVGDCDCERLKNNNLEFCPFCGKKIKVEEGE